MIANRDTPGAWSRLDGDARTLLAELDVRPLSARSLLLSYLLDTHPPEVSAARLAAFGELMGQRPGTIRTALSRMVAAGDAETDQRRYRLAGRLLERQELQDLSQRPTAEWGGDWWTAIVVADDRSVTDRRHFRAAMIGARFGEVRPDIWLRPANVPGPAARPELTLTRGPLVSGDGAELARRLWDLPAIEATSQRLLDVLEPLGAALDTDDPTRTLPLTFEVSAACVRHFRIEPQLPPELVDLPVSARLRATYVDVNRRFRSTLDAHLRPDGDRTG